MHVVRGVLILMIGLATAACVGVYVAARMTSTLPGRSRLPDGAFERQNASNRASRSRPAGGTYGKNSAAEDATHWSQPSLETLCREKSEHLRRQIGQEDHVLVRQPFVIVGDTSPAALERKHSSTIGPAWQAMARHYFQRPPDRPIALLLFSDEMTYRRYAELLFFDRNAPRFGYFKPGRYTVLANLAWGDGPLLHELTHALMHFDFPEAAVWLREGLASLHETSSLVAEGKLWTLEGKGNWRLEVLRRHILAGRLPSLQNLLQAVDFDGENEAIHCAQARYFCLFLQQEEVLAEVYQRYRTSHDEDPRGEKAVLRAFPGFAWQDLDAEFNGRVMSASEDVVARRAGI